MKMKDTVTFKNLNGLISMVQAMPMESGAAITDQIEENLTATEGRKALFENPGKCFYDAAKEQFFSQYFVFKRNPVFTQSKTGPDDGDIRRWEEQKGKFLAKLQQFAEYAESQPLNVGHWAEGIFAYIYPGNFDSGIVIPTPEKWLTLHTGKEYDGISPAELRAAIGGNVSNDSLALGGKESTMAPQEVRDQQAKLSELADDLKRQIEDVKDGKTAELAAMQAEIDQMVAAINEKKNALMTELNAKKAELEAKVEQMEVQIYLLEGQIYNILCYAGETVQFTKLLSGQNAPDTEPIVIHQKLRFLDEDLGRLASIYSISWGNISSFENLLKHNPVALDTFAPPGRSIQLVRLSRNNKQYGAYTTAAGDETNILAQYEYWHGTTIGIIIRNGDNVYVGWTDEQKINIQDDFIVDLSKSTVVEEETPDRFVNEEASRKKAKAELMRFASGYFSRQFVFNILQGVVDHSNILPLPDGVTLGKQSEYVVYSMADAALEDNRFGTFTDIVERFTAEPQKGDTILTVQRLVPEFSHSGAFSRYSPWNNPRGRGAANRTHDASVDDCTLYRINLIDHDEPVSIVRFRRRIEGAPSIGIEATMQECTMPAGDYIEACEKDEMPNPHFYYGSSGESGLTAADITPYPGDEIVEVYERRKAHVFVSVEKSDSRFWGRGSTPARANIEILSDEYINLTYMNSVVLEYIVSTKKLGNLRVGGATVDYAYFIQYLKTALEHVRAREVKEKALIDAIAPSFCENPDWPLLLSEWKMAHNVHHMTEYQAKRFISAMS